MIHYVARRDHRAGMHAYLRSFGRRQAHLIRLVAWEDALSASAEEPAWAPGVCILSDLDRLNDDELRGATRLHDALCARGIRCLNNPARVLRRGPLLRALHDAGINDFRALPASDPRSLMRARLPAFVREANEHWGPIGGLAHTRVRLAARLLAAVAKGHTPRDLLIVEFRDYRSEDGLFRKYAAFRVGDLIIARHLLGGEDWMVKFSRGLPERLIGEELEFVRANAHAGALMRVFEIAGVEYGRADFGVIGDRLVIFEINTNPLVARPRREHDPSRLEALGVFIRRYRAALRSLDAGSGGPVPLAERALTPGTI